MLAMFDERDGVVSGFESCLVVGMWESRGNVIGMQTLPFCT
jgi:hypothetical protein